MKGVLPSCDLDWVRRLGFTLNHWDSETSALPSRIASCIPENCVHELLNRQSAGNQFLDASEKSTSVQDRLSNMSGLRDSVEIYQRSLGFGTCWLPPFANGKISLVRTPTMRETDTRYDCLPLFLLRTYIASTNDNPTLEETIEYANPECPIEESYG